MASASLASQAERPTASMLSSLTRLSQRYKFSLVQTSKWTKTGLHLSIVLTKKDQKKGYWVRLTKQPNKSQYIQCDWNKWVDEDEEHEEGHKGLEGIDPEAMNNFNDSDSDD
jgi:prostaglandin-E synthase